MQIYRVQCPQCEQDTDCAVEVNAAGTDRVMCAWCGSYFDRSESPRVLGSAATVRRAPAGTRRPEVIREFPHQPFRDGPAR